MYDFYKAYCEHHGIVTDDERIFVAKLKQRPEIKVRNMRIEGEKTRVWIGLKVKPLKDLDAEESEETQQAQPTDESGTHGTLGTLVSTSEKVDVEIPEKEREKGE